MILKNFQDQSGTWHDSCIVEQFDIDSLLIGPYERTKDKVLKVVPLGRPVNPHCLVYGYVDADNGMVNAALGMIKTRFNNLKTAFFEYHKKGKTINAYGPDGFYFNDGSAPATESAQPTKEKIEKHQEAKCLDNWEALLSTRRILAMTGATIYDGPEFKFKSNRRESPAAGAIDGLAKDYSMNVIIPNALLAMHLLGKKANAYWDGNCFGKALRYCMTTGKSQKSIDAWEAYLKETEGKELSQLWNKYVANVGKNGEEIADDHKWYFKKYVDMRCKENTTKFRKSKNDDELKKLLDMMDTETELKTASRRRLVELGYSETLARRFMKARNLNTR